MTTDDSAGVWLHFRGIVVQSVDQSRGPPVWHDIYEVPASVGAGAYRRHAAGCPGGVLPPTDSMAGQGYATTTELRPRLFDGGEYERVGGDVFATVSVSAPSPLAPIGRVLIGKAGSDFRGCRERRSIDHHLVEAHPAAYHIVNAFQNAARAELGWAELTPCISECLAIINRVDFPSGGGPAEP